MEEQRIAASPDQSAESSDPDEQRDSNQDAFIVKLEDMHLIQLSINGSASSAQAAVQDGSIDLSTATEIELANPDTQTPTKDLDTVQGMPKLPPELRCKIW